jgi:hypothetical protein
MCNCSPEVLTVVSMAAKISGDSILGVSGIIFHRIQDSFTTRSASSSFA